MIALDPTIALLEESLDRAKQLNGRCHDDPEPHTSTPPKAVRAERARTASELQLIATRLELAAALIRNEYWFARGECDALDPNRRD